MPAGSTVEYDVKLLRFVKVGRTVYIVTAMQRRERGGVPACWLAAALCQGGSACLLACCSYAKAGGVQGWVQAGCGRGCA